MPVIQKVGDLQDKMKSVTGEKKGGCSETCLLVKIDFPNPRFTTVSQFDLMRLPIKRPAPENESKQLSVCGNRPRSGA